MNASTIVEALQPLGDNVPATASLYALIDISALPGGQQHPALRCLGPGIVCGTSLSTASQPTLFGPTDLRSDMATHCVELDASVASVHFLWAEAPVQELAQHLTQLTQGLDEDGNDLFVRYFDRSIWPYYWAALTQRQRDLVLGPVVMWATFEEGASWATKHREGAHRASDAPASRRYTRQQTHQMMLATLPHALWASLEDEFPEHAGDERGVLAVLRPLVDRAAALGLSRWSDFYRFAHMGLGIHERFDVHPEVAVQLARIKASDATLDDALGAVDPSVWGALVDASQPGRSS